MGGAYTIRRPRLRSLTPLLGLVVFVVIATRTDLVPPFATAWSSIREVVLLSPGPFGDEGPPEVGVRLKPGAPLPSGATSIVHDPRQPDAVDPEPLARMGKAASIARAWRRRSARSAAACRSWT